jgi:hypothetical protein
MTDPLDAGSGRLAELDAALVAMNGIARATIPTTMTPVASQSRA